MGDMRNIVVVPYSPDWPALYQREAARIRTIFGQALISIHHIGSTSIPGIRAKPVIDIMPVVHTVEQVDSFNLAMAQLGYEAKEENEIPGRRYFVKGGDDHRTHHVHTYEPDNPEVARHLDFRDYVIAHPEAKQQYETLKIDAACQFPHDIIGYMDMKDGFIRDTIQKAHAWRIKQTDGGQ